MTLVMDMDWYCPKCKRTLKPNGHTMGDDGEHLFLNCHKCAIFIIVQPRFKDDLQDGG